MNHESMLFSWGSDRSAARSLPKLFLPQAAEIRSALGLNTRNGAERLQRALHQLATDAALETRLFLASALDPVWLSPCSDDPCHHRNAFRVVEDSARDCALGMWNFDEQRYELQILKGSVAQAIPAVAADKILVTHLSPAIRAAAPASLNGCCKQDAAALLWAALDAHRRGMTASEDQYQHSASDALIAARSLLTVASAGNDSLLYEHLTAYADDATAMTEFLEALAAAAEENPALGATTRRLSAWGNEPRAGSPRCGAQPTGTVNLRATRSGGPVARDRLRLWLSASRSRRPAPSMDDRP